MHSTLAGFLEPGESLEESVAREIFEESGVCISDITYHSSQPWAFPSSLMVGFMARATSRVINVDNNELEYANWYSREWLKNIEDSDIFRLPGEYSIARRLIEDWIDQKIPFS
jgi:NAD+ diphosphatase